jgi:hypothetical protein
MSKQKYQWKMESLAKQVDVNKVVDEMEKIKDLYGSLKPENIVQYAATNESVLSKLFEWDDTKAAYNYRLQQARIILNNIEVKIVSDGEEKEVPVYEITKRKGGLEYTNIEAMTSNEAEQVRKNTIQQLNQLKKKLEIYNNFKSVIKHINEALTELTQENQ